MLRDTKLHTVQWNAGNENKEIWEDQISECKQDERQGHSPQRCGGGTTIQV
jgi:hypothetical protein